MRIERMQIHGFGRMKDVDIVLSEALTVIGGRNEAGKSTILQFVRAMLFGIPGRAYPTERYEPVSGGAHGGVLTMKDDEGAQWVISRYTQRQEGTASRGERLSITRRDSLGIVEQISQEEMERRLLGGVSRDMFRQLFAISLSELQEIRTLQSDEMNSYLFHAGIGGGADIVRAERKLLQDMDKIYKPRGRVQESAKLLQQIEQLEGQITQSTSYLKLYNDNTSSLIEKAEHLVSQEAVRAEYTYKLTLFRKAQEIRPIWLKWLEAEMDRQALPPITNFPEQGYRRWQSLQEENERIRSETRRLQRIEQDLREKLNLLITNDPLLDMAGEIERLSRRSEYYETRLMEKQEMGLEVVALEQQLERLLRQMNPDWGINELKRLSGAASEREAVRKHAAGFASYDRRMEALAAQRQQVARQCEGTDYEYRRSVKQVEEASEIGASKFQMLIPRNRHEVSSLWNEIQLEAERWREERINRSSDRQRDDQEKYMRTRMRDLYVKLLWGSLVVTLLLPALLWFLGSPLGAGVAASVFIIVDAILWVNSKDQKAERRKEGSQMGQERDGILARKMASMVDEEQIAAALESSNSGASVSDIEIESALRQLRRLMENWQTWQEKMDKLRSDSQIIYERAEVLKLDMANVEDSLAREQCNFERLDEQWQQWLQDHGLSLHLSPERVMDLFGLAEQAMELFGHLEKGSRKKSMLAEECSTFEQEARSVLSDEMLSSGLRVSALIEIKKKELEAQQEIRRQRDLVSSSLEPVVAQLKQLEDESNRILALMKELLFQGGALDGESFLRRAASVERKEELTRSIREWEISMFSGWDVQRQRALQNILAEYDEVALDEATSEAGIALSKAEAVWNDLQQQQGRLLQERERLEQLCRHDTALQQLDEQRAALKDMVARYAVLSLSAELIARTRRIYEEEKQPQVLKLATEYFSRLTEGAYIRIVMKLGEKKLLAEHRDLGLTDSALLSRGTAEQLYLAMRFALADIMNTGSCIPLLFDDIFVNFDEERMLSALSLLGESSSKRQVILLTCHRYVLDHVGKLIPQAQIISI
ncbi:AAA family ATPase [Paenibacillus pini]|uniref:YhaN AAA domain-containing protein n=1 Tax=Paenibacillus pini JCM 16418 TaxID=1236976 RepID=W7YVV7_9BACL|nr:AAA family ATPase [Paenibacillus pini]GAF06514.1 hypothetical protein JCM16418_473 [Paenibacillus pini JCM 16418]